MLNLSPPPAGDSMSPQHLDFLKKKQVFNDADNDGNGSLSKDEFEKAWGRYGSQLLPFFCWIPVSKKDR